jgi:membrane protein insertase Oxa1/YidC/SpoIIIJ
MYFRSIAYYMTDSLERITIIIVLRKFTNFGTFIHFIRKVYQLSINFREVKKVTGTISAILALSIPIIAILTTHFQKQTKLKHKMLIDAMELEKLKHQNFLIETEKMRLELDKMKIEK